MVDFIDPDWDADERDFIARYVGAGVVARHYLGYSACRVCGDERNGTSEFSEGAYVWPSGLANYIEEHGVRLPAEFVRHAYAVDEHHFACERGDDWWRSAGRDW